MIRVTRDKDLTKANILAAAQAEFAEHGLGGARVDVIAARAGINKKMLYYYFGNKDELFTAVLEATYQHIRAKERELELDAVDPIEAIRRLVAFTWHYYLKHPEFLRLLNTENQHRAVHLGASGKLRTMHSPFVELINSILKRGHAKGIFKADIDPVQLYISIAALSYFYIGNNHTLSAYFGRNLLAKKAREARLTHMTELVLAYLIA